MPDQEFGQVSEIKLREAKADADLAVNSGYDPETFVTTNIPMTTDLRAYMDLNRLKAVTEAEAGNIQRLKNLEDEKEARQVRQQDAFDDLTQTAQEREQWLKDKHEFGGIELTGKQWSHVSKYVENNESRLLQEILERNPGMSKADAQLELDAIKAIDDKPSQARTELLEKANQRETFTDTTVYVAEQSGMPINPASPKVETNVHRSIEVAPEPQIGAF